MNILFKVCYSILGKNQLIKRVKQQINQIFNLQKPVWFDLI